MKSLVTTETRLKSRKGAALIETALLLPILLLLILNMVNLGIYIFAWITVNNAARAAAEYSAYNGAAVNLPAQPTFAQIQGLTNNEVSSLPNYAANTNPTLRVCSNTNGTLTCSGSCSGTCSTPADPEPSGLHSQLCGCGIFLHARIQCFQHPVPWHIADSSAFGDSPAGRHEENAMRRVMRNERGQTLLEYSVVILTVLTVIFGVFETARLVLAYTTLAEAARAGARYAVVHGADCTGACVPDDGTATAQNVASAAGLTSATATTTYSPPGTTVPGTLVTVTVSYTFVPVTPLAALGVPLSSTTEAMIVY